MDDLICRQMAVDALSTPHGIMYPIRTIESLPSVDAVPRASVEYICRKNTVSTNPYEHKYHDKFIQFMDDPEISDFGRWQHSNGFNTALVAVKCDLEKVPSAQSGWIPCSEGMPEEHEWIGTKKFGTTISNEVYVTFETPDGERFTRHISFQNGKLSAVDEQHMKVWYKGAKPIAWMPLPEPYKEERQEKA